LFVLLVSRDLLQYFTFENTLNSSSWAEGNINAVSGTLVRRDLCFAKSLLHLWLAVPGSILN